MTIIRRLLDSTPEAFRCLTLACAALIVFANIANIADRAGGRWA